MTAARSSGDAPPEVAEDLPAAMPADEPPPEGPEASPPEGRRSWLLERLRLDQTDVLVMALFLGLAFTLRYFSPIMPDLLMGRPDIVSNCVTNTPIDAQNHTGTLCGLAYPYQRSYAAPGQAPQPPNGQVFDEIYFGVFAHDDLKGVSYFDPEPPLSKLIIASGEWLYGWWRSVTTHASGDYADLGFNTFGWRLMSVIFGSLTVPLMYLFARKLWPNRLFAIAAATLVCFDGMFFVQSRIGMIDIFPIFLIMLSYTLFLVHRESRSERDSIVTLLLTGTALGLAIASKWISLAALVSIVFFLVMEPVRHRVRLTLGEGIGAWRWGASDGPDLPGGARIGRYLPAALLAFALIPLVIYVASWIPFFTRHQFHTLGDLVDYQRQAYIYHATLTATHPYGSPWFSWPFLYRPVAYYYEYQGLGVDAITHHPLVAGIVDLGNPLVWWASIPAVLMLPYFVFRHRSFPAAVILVGFVTQYLPWARITRVIFLYHMFGGLIFMVLALAFVLARMAQAGPLRIEFAGDRIELTGRYLVPAYLAIVVLSFLYFYPLWTGLPISDSSYLSGFPLGKMWLSKWI
jgi:dolichyl-phosphate-mannose-protein mannosyltransferase